MVGSTVAIATVIVVITRIVLIVGVIGTNIVESRGRRDDRLGGLKGIRFHETRSRADSILMHGHKGLGAKGERRVGKQEDAG